MKKCKLENPVNTFFAFEVFFNGYRRHSLHQHHYHEFYLCTAGPGRQRLLEAEIPMNPGDLFFFPANSLHHGDGQEGFITTGHVLNIYPEGFSLINTADREAGIILESLSRVTENGIPLLKLSQEGSDAVRQIFASMVSEQTGKQPGYRGAIKPLAHQLLLLLIRDPCSPGPLRNCLGAVDNYQRMEDVLRFLDLHFSQPLTVEQVAEMAHLSRSHFHAVFRRETGYTLVEYLNRLRIAEAERLLRDTCRTITAIAQQAGFPCLSHFYQTFSRQTGQSPYEYKISLNRKEKTVTANHLARPRASAATKKDF